MSPRPLDALFEEDEDEEIDIFATPKVDIFATSQNNIETNQTIAKNLETLRKNILLNHENEEVEEEAEQEIENPTPIKETKKKNFFDMDDEEEANQPPKAEKKAINRNRANIPFDQDKNIRNRLDELFGRDEEHTEHENVDETREVQEEPLYTDRKDELKAQYPHLFMTDDIFDPNDPNREQLDEKHYVKENEKPKTARPLDALFDEDEEEYDPFAKIDVDITAKSNKKVEEKELTTAQKLEMLRRNILMNEVEDDADELEEIPDVNEEQKAIVEETKIINDSANIAVFVNQLNTFNGMYKSNVDANNFAASVSDAWTLLVKNDEQKINEGKKILGDLFKNTLKEAFDIEKNTSYEENRLPEYAEIIKSANELLRSSMFAFTDLYHNPKSASLFDSTAFGGLDAKQMAEISNGDSLWSMDQKSDKAWEIQSFEAKSISDRWLGENKPYETMINEMKALADLDKKDTIDRKEIYIKLAAAEWLLLNNEKMMIDNPEDPLNKVPNWGNRYWKAITEARNTLGIPRHISMRELIQGDYAESAKAVNNIVYTETQINENVLSSEERAICDSMDKQREQFATQSAAVTLTEPQNDINHDEPELTADRVPYPIKELDERVIMKNQPKNYDFVVERTAEINLSGPNQR